MPLSPAKKSKWPKLTMEEMKQIVEYRVETKKPRPIEKMQNRLPQNSK